MLTPIIRKTKLAARHSIENSIPVGSRVKVWFDKKNVDLIVEGHGSRVRNIYGVCLGEVEFGTERTSRGAVRCIAVGNLLADPNTNEGFELKVHIRREAGGSLDFYWWKNTSWPIASARLALLAPPHGGFPTCAAVDPQ